MPAANNKYVPLGDYLKTHTTEHVWLSLEQLAEMLGGLPAEASKPQFWANTKDHHRSRRDQWRGAGFNAFLRSRDGRLGVAFERVKSASHGLPWSTAELRVCVLAYRKLIIAEERGQRLSKTDLRNEALAQGLASRSESAYEFRMQNISAVLDELGIKRATGYAPMKNVGDVKTTLIELINEQWGRLNDLETPTDDEEALATRVVSARQKFTRAKHDAPPGSQDVRKSLSATERFVRDPNVIAWALNRAAGKCEVCEAPAPFVVVNGEPFLEVHHVRPLGEGGPDTPDNACACCPNCHRQLHFGMNAGTLRRRLLSRASYLVDYPMKKDGEREDTSVEKGTS
ncbi:HNH endonuclease [Bradyrhizobium sp. 151]|uniref:HNH endonuclease n=1 Tax=Bradyrhizobium sp. 151 TaxID=2782626 RepID=UPI001FF890F3|nr:HNH endonuclease [Bradyrhizobium sp. 151]MCK1658599.1 HNH endonuclease [Bradyrhizobium sp. 151]